MILIVAVVCDTRFPDIHARQLSRQIYHRLPIYRAAYQTKSPARREQSARTSTLRENNAIHSRPIDIIEVNERRCVLHHGATLPIEQIHRIHREVMVDKLSQKCKCSGKVTFTGVLAQLRVDFARRR